MTHTSTLTAQAKKIREHNHRLRPTLRLKTQSDIVQFIHENGLVSVLGGNELPSLISAILGRMWNPSAKGFTGWTEWWSLKVEGQQLSHLFGSIERRDDILGSRIFRRSKTVIASELWAILDPIIKHQRELAIRDKTVPSSLESNLLQTIESEGSIRTDRLRKQINLEGKENNYKFHKALLRLESQGLIIGAEDPQPETHLHANIWRTWDGRTRGKIGRSSLTHNEALVDLLKRTIDACVIVSEKEIGSFFEWGGEMRQAVATLTGNGSIVRDGSNLISDHALNKRLEPDD